MSHLQRFNIKPVFFGIEMEDLGALCRKVVGSRVCALVLVVVLLGALIALFCGKRLW